MSHPVVPTQALLVELLTEELPPKALPALEQAFAQGVQRILNEHKLLESECELTTYSTPRRLALLLSAVRWQAPDDEYTEKLMPAAVGLSPSGEMTPALQKRLAAKGLAELTVADLITESDGKQDFLYAKGVARGATLASGLQAALDYSVTHLPIPKAMQYSLPDGRRVRFVRPAHGLLVLWGDDVIPANALGLPSGRTTQGHRFMGTPVITLEHATEYEERLASEGKVIASFSKRRALIWEALQQAALCLNASLGDAAAAQELLDEVTALVEHPTIYTGAFDPAFLRVPAECLILTMRRNQRYFPLFNESTGELTHHFLIVSNMEVADPQPIINGNERVVRPRLADAQFFYDTDLKTKLEARVEALKTAVYHNKLGSQFERVQRIQAIAKHLAATLGANQTLCDRAALLSKADLTTGMVGEFPELQGIMGAYYAQHDGEDAAVVQALREQYRLRFRQTIDANGLVSVILFMAERLETLVGIWGIGLTPTGERDPFGLRRAALGLISAYEQLTADNVLAISKSEQLSLSSVLQFSAQQFAHGLLLEDTSIQVETYIRERYRHQLLQHHDHAVVDAVLAVAPPLHQVQARLAACETFSKQAAALSLAAANKRVANILRRSTEPPAALETALLREAAEQRLAQQIAHVGPQARAHIAAGDFVASMAALADIKETVDAFFDQVMIMVDDAALRANRLALLRDLYALMNEVADISRLES